MKNGRHRGRLKGDITLMVRSQESILRIIEKDLRKHGDLDSASEVIR